MEPDADTVKRNVVAALAEDVGSGDISADLIEADARARARIVTREPGIFCGRPWAEEACRQVDPAVRLDWRVEDGAPIASGDALLDLDGPARSLLTVERTVLNLLQLLSATATRTRRYVDAVAGTTAVILDTRKTIPGLRIAQKYAVRTGGGRNHRMGLFDAILLKENHIAAAGGIAAAVREARRRHPGKSVEVEVENHHELAAAIDAGADRILLDNFPVDEMRVAVETTAGRVPLEASGGITLDNVVVIGATGVDYISVGELTKNVTPLDLSMRFVGIEQGQPSPMTFEAAPHLQAIQRAVASATRDGNPVRTVTLSRVFATSADDLWDAVTSAERIPRWFLPVSGELKPGGRYQLEGNAGGTVTVCDAPSRFAVTWEIQGDVSWVEVAVTDEGRGQARLTLTHTASDSPHYTEYGPGATGVGWEFGLVGLAIHVEHPDEPQFDEAGLVASAEGKAFISGSSLGWAQAAVTDGEDPSTAHAAAERTAAFYTG